jgi:predicted secreted protein
MFSVLHSRHSARSVLRPGPPLCRTLKCHRTSRFIGCPSVCPNDIFSTCCQAPPPTPRSGERSNAWHLPARNFQSIEADVGVRRIRSEMFPKLSILVVLMLFGSACAVDNVITEIRFADPYRHWSASQYQVSSTIAAGDVILIRMNENPGTGFTWIIVQDFDSQVCTLQPTSNFSTGIYEPSTSTDGSDDKVVDGVARPYVPPGAGDWPYPYPWGDRRFDLRCKNPGAITIKLRYKRSWEDRYTWESQLMLTVLENS